MHVVIAIAALIGLALLSAGAAQRTNNNRLTRMAISGLWGAALIGLLLGTETIGLVNARSREMATPLIMATLGWVGMMIGLQFRREVMARVPRAAWRLVAADTAATVLGWCPLAAMLVWWCFPAERPDALLGAAARITAAIIGWSSETRSLRPADDRATSPGESTLRASGAVASLVAICLYGVAVFGVIGVRRYILEPENLLPGVAGCASGLVLAILGGSLLGRFGFRLAGRSRGDQLVVFLGTLIFVTGIAAKMGVPGLMTTAIVGMIIGNSRGFGAREFERFLMRAEVAAATLLGLLVGISATTDIGPPELCIAGAMVAWRILVKPAIVRAVLGRDTTLCVSAIRPHPVTLALSLGVMIRAQDSITSKACTIILLSTISSDLIAWMIARWMRTRTDVRAPRGVIA